MTAELWWTVRQTSRKRWRPEDGWLTREDAERSAAFYRRDRHRRCVVVFGEPNTERFSWALLSAVLAP